MDNIVLKCENVNKSFGKKKILYDVSFEMYPGDILGFIGPNGSGKTTTIKTILGLYKLDKGKVSINDYDITKDFENAIKKVGAIVENPDLYMYISGYDNLKLIANLYKGISKERIDEVVKLVKLENRIKDKVSKYSLGMRQRLGIAQAILHNPNLLILDEPTNGLDPEGIKDLRDLLKDLSSKGMSILISSHNLSELESFCNKVCIIQNGKVIETTEVKKLKKEKKENIYIFEIDNTDNISTLFKESNVINETIFELKTEKEKIPSIIKKLIKENKLIYGVSEKTITLEEAFLNKTGGNKID